MSKQKIRVAHSPDSDDAFMFYALATRKIDTGNLSYEHTLADIETLNRKAMEGEYEVSAVSFHAYAYLDKIYGLLSCGGSVGRDYGPVVVSTRPLTPKALTETRVAVPGTMTTAFLALRLFAPEVQYEVVEFDQILEAMSKGRFQAGLLIHEGQLTYGDRGFHKVLDLGAWWLEQEGLPLPLGANVIRRDLGLPLIREVAGHVRASIRYGLEHRQEAMDYAMGFSRGLDPHRADRFVGMYVNEMTLDYGEEGRQAIRTLLARAYERGLVPQRPDTEFVA